MSKFLLRCSCLVCKKEITTQSLKAHLQSHSIKSFNKICLSCSLPCKDKFCSHSCSAKYNNSLWGPSKKNLPKGFRKGFRYVDGKQVPPSTKLYECEICHKLHPLVGRTCSKGCKSKLLSLLMLQRISDGFNPQQNRGRSKRSWLEASFKQWLDIKYPFVVFETEKSFKRKDITKTYFVDFHFPELSLVIELDGTQHGLSTEYDSLRDDYLSQTYGLTILRISHKEYIKKTRIEEIQKYLERRTGLEPAYDQ